MNAAAEIVARLAADADSNLARSVAGRGPRDADFGPWLRAVHFGVSTLAVVRVFGPFEAESHALVGRKRLRMHPRRKSIRRARLDKRDVADSGKIDIAASVENEPQRALAGMLFFSVKRRLHAKRSRRVNPRESTAVDAGLEAAVPNQRTRRIVRRRNRIGERHSLRPDAVRIVDAMRLHERIGERNDLRQTRLRRRLERSQLLPYRQRRIHRRVGIELTNRIEINRRAPAAAHFR